MAETYSGPPADYKPPMWFADGRNAAEYVAALLRGDQAAADAIIPEWHPTLVADAMAVFLVKVLKSRRLLARAAVNPAGVVAGWRAGFGEPPDPLPPGYEEAEAAYDPEAEARARLAENLRATAAALEALDGYDHEGWIAIMMNADASGMVAILARECLGLGRKWHGDDGMAAWIQGFRDKAAAIDGMPA